jgi:MOSC domain-containing protein YiiM
MKLDRKDTDSMPDVKATRGTVVAVCISRGKGTRKEDVGSCEIIENHGLKGDAHAGPHTHRQVCLLAQEGIDRMVAQGYGVGPGDFAENITTKGIDLLSLRVGERIRIGNSVELEITQKGKECHDGCAVFKDIGVCIARDEAIFGRVIHGGAVQRGNPITLFPAV